ncbi:MAG: hypothetical protein U0792_00045 [Gemmataceae bacterium]
MANRVVEQFDKQIQIHEARLTAMRVIREAVAQDPEFVTLVQDILLEPGSNGVPAPERATTSRAPDVFNYERIIHALLTNNNEWCAIREISRKTLLTRTAVNNVLYVGGHRHLFEEQHISKGRVVWRVSPKASTGVGFPESCLPLFESLYSGKQEIADQPVEVAKVETPKAEPEVVTPSPFVPAKNAPTKPTPPSKYARTKAAGEPAVIKS